ncbi:competence type IV pilus ATPase ComGA [Heyndrickxia ginsengihumi]|uniref:competence type IV pilus ATPase ComGA n=1 Tax=Heyndrickxia ginsengihumi TaxID=363870 RepID=UPI0004707FC4|nr:competence type IV pilus ATPase ComGA [Heyndrickxia ginsengihumi]MBE6183765.1 type II/IV secretion system protein [Bacillus sp. (in: firmicutes)]MCM3022775.1 GspE/PulE family protein [Heyndrickxia ginsengihumi]
MSIEKIVELLLSHALNNKVTDVHIVPRRHDYHVQFRQFGRIYPHRNLSSKTGERLISHLKFMSTLDISEKRKPQSGSFQLNLSKQLVSLRISTLPTSLSKESLVIRILPNDDQISLDQLSLFPSSLKKLLALIQHSHGMIIFTGPTGSGKSTTMYTLVEHCANKLMRNVITLEDPVEKQSDSFLQVQVNEKAGITYSTGLKAILRHDPDIILVGEIRDGETAQIAVRAALTGHLVLSTMHTRDAKGAVYRLQEFGVKPQEIEQTLLAISAQRLILLQCPVCGVQYSQFCIHHLKNRQAAVYELLYGRNLQKAIREANGEKVHCRYVTIRDWLRKGIALGYISTEEYYRWIVEDEEQEEHRGSREFSHSY